ncbi:DUF6349 family protein [Streptomyces sp. NPDC005728]|uniref:DUF6349 family protein n=1 Tax=Streptomyces sp. NPDC005728 TaxID=3157054 RepID=UPI0033CD499D
MLHRSPSGRGTKVWWRHVKSRYPEGWFDASGPLRLYPEPLTGGRPLRPVGPFGLG